MYKKLVSLLLSFSLCVSLLSITVFAVTPTPVLRVNNEEITSTNRTVKCGLGVAQFNPKTNELLLSDAYLTNGGIYCSNLDLHVVLVGKNYIKDNVVDEDDSYGIYVENGNLTITGSGDLSIDLEYIDGFGLKATDADIEGEFTNGSITIDIDGNLSINTYSTNIRADKNISILNGKTITLEVKPSTEYASCIMARFGVATIDGNADITVTTEGGYGIFSRKGIELNNSGSLYISAAAGLHSCPDARDEGYVRQTGNGPITINALNNCITTAKSTELLGASEINLSSVNYHGINCLNGDVTIDNNNDITIKCKDNAVSANNKITVNNNNTITIITENSDNYDSHGFEGDKGVEIINEGIIEIQSEIGIETVNGDISITGKGLISVTADTYGIYFRKAYKFIAEDAGAIDITSNNANAVYCGTDGASIEINGEVDSLSLRSASGLPIFKFRNEGYTCPINIEKPELYNVKGSVDSDFVSYDFKTFAISFDMGGHGMDIPTRYALYGRTVPKPADPEAEGFTFGGWYIDKDFTEAFDFDTEITSDIVLYAKWNCPHLNTEVINKKDATLTEAGYTGDTYCNDCDSIISAGSTIPTLAPTTTAAPTGGTTTPTAAPTTTVAPTAVPTSAPTAAPTSAPTSAPTTAPTSTVAPTAAPTAAPELNVGDFINRCYSVALGREADEGGYNYWVESLTGGQACGAQVGYGFIFSQEYINKDRTDEEFVNDMYAMYFGRSADSDGFNYWVDLLESGLTREDIMAGFANSEEFYNLCNKYGVVCGTYLVGVPNDVQGGVNCFVARLYKVCLNRLPDMGGQGGWVLKLMSGDVSGTTCAYGFVFSPEFIGKNPSNEDFVNYMYAAFFGREADEAGFNAWVNVLNGGGSYEDVFAGFSGSAEFANLCAGYGIQA